MVSDKVLRLNPYLHQGTPNLFGLSSPALPEAAQTRAHLVVAVPVMHKKWSSHTGQWGGAVTALRDQRLANYEAKVRQEDCRT